MLAQYQQDTCERQDLWIELNPIHAKGIYQIPWIQWIPVPFRENSSKTLSMKVVEQWFFLNSSVHPWHVDFAVRQVKILEKSQCLFLITSWFSSGGVKFGVSHPDGPVGINSSCTVKIAFRLCGRPLQKAFRTRPPSCLAMQPAILRLTFIENCPFDSFIAWH